MYDALTKHMESIIRIFKMPKKYRNQNNLVFDSYATFTNFFLNSVVTALCYRLVVVVEKG